MCVSVLLVYWENIEPRKYSRNFVGPIMGEYVKLEWYIWHMHNFMSSPTKLNFLYMITYKTKNISKILKYKNKIKKITLFQTANQTTNSLKQKHNKYHTQ